VQRTKSCRFGITEAATSCAILLAVGLSLSGCVSGSGGGAVGGDGWLEKQAALNESKRMGAKGMKPVSLDCRINAVSNAVPTYSIKLEWAPAKAGTRWKWRVGGLAAIARDDASARLAGLHKVFSKTASHHSGVSAACVIWES
jgi:hypothetical protein